MPAYTSNVVTGDFFANGSWVGGIAPDPNGIDTTTLANGAALTVATAVTAKLGDPANPTVPAIARVSTNGTGRLICNGKLEIAANVAQGNANWEFNGAGVKIESTNTTTALTWEVAGGNGQTNARLTLAGTGIGAGRAIIRNGTGAAGLRFTTGGNIACWTTAFARLEDLGTASLNALVYSSGDSGVASGSSFEDTVIDNCGLVSGGTHQVLSPLTYRRLLIKNTKNTTRAITMPLSIANASGARVIEDVTSINSVVEVAFPSTGTVFPTFTRCYFDTFTRTGTGPGTFVDCVWRRRVTGGGGTVVGGSITRGLSVINSTARDNWHGLAVSVTGATVTVDGLIFDGVLNPAFAGNGDLLFMPVGTASPGTTVNIRNVLSTVANTTSGSYGKMTSQINGQFSNPVLGVIENCTWITGNAEEGLCGVGETVVGVSGMLGTVRNNLIWGRSAGQGVVILRHNTGAAANLRDPVLPANATNNAVVNPFISAVNGNGNNTAAGGDGLMWSASPATYATVTDPNMVDDTRNLATWYRSVVGGTPGTRTADMELALTGIAEQWGDSPNPDLNIPAAWTWIREGLRPQNTALLTNVSANNGGWLGAVEGIATGGPIAPGGYRLRRGPSGGD